VHGQRRSKFTEYGVRLREKQKVRNIYGVLERQLRRYFAISDRARGVTGENLLNNLERRLDSTCCRAGFGTTRSDARQLVRHKHIKVNGRTVNIPSFQVRPGDKIEIREKSKKKTRIQTALEVAGRREASEWLELDQANLIATVKAMPAREAITLPIQEQLIVEFYSR
jgi:small subunit ribosomal protein S4